MATVTISTLTVTVGPQPMTAAPTVTLVDVAKLRQTSDDLPLRPTLDADRLKP